MTPEEPVNEFNKHQRDFATKMIQNLEELRMDNIGTEDVIDATMGWLQSYLEEDMVIDTSRENNCDDCERPSEPIRDESRT